VNADKINKWLTLAANVAVVAGIFFLALELSQNSRMMHAQTRNVDHRRHPGFPVQCRVIRP
jgi:hypothetical protein